MRIGLCSSAFGALAVAAAMPVVAQAQSPAVQFRVPAGPLQTALPLFATQSGEQILYSTDLVAGRQSAGVSGALRTDQALTTLLQGTGLRARRTSPNTLVVYDPDARADATDEAVEIEDVVVTGSLIRGVADGPSPVVTVTRDEMDRNGRATVAQLLASLPQNFGGTANEGALGNGGDRSGTNSTYANGVNLRGLGSDATLVLINGRRLAGTGAKGDFVDVSTIPTAAVERVDILLDGASALYGADAVGGVVNIILRDDYDGAETRVRVGNTSDGASGEYQVAQVLGRQWSTGSAMLTYEYYDREALAGSERRRAGDADHRWLGGSDRRSFYSNPGNIVVLDPATGSYIPRYSIPDGQNGVGLLPADFRLGQTNLENFRATSNILPRQTRQSAYAAARQSFGDRFEISGDARWGMREYETVSTAISTLLTVRKLPSTVEFRTAGSRSAKAAQSCAQAAPRSEAPSPRPAPNDALRSPPPLAARTSGRKAARASGSLIMTRPISRAFSSALRHPADGSVSASSSRSATSQAPGLTDRTHARASVNTSFGARSAMTARASARISSGIPAPSNCIITRSAVQPSSQPPSPAKVSAAAVSRDRHPA